MRFPIPSILLGLFSLPLISSAANSIQSFPAPYATVGHIERLDPAIDALIPKDAKLEKLAEGFRWSEGPVWHTREGYLTFSDVPANIAYRWKEGEGVSVFLTPSGFTGEKFDGREPGSNGEALDNDGLAEP